MKDGRSTEKIETYRHIDERDKFIRQKGEKEFIKLCKVSPKMAQLQDIEIPECYTFVFNHFLEIWHYAASDFNGNKIITFGTINDYVRCMKVPLEIRHRKMILKIKDWAEEQISIQSSNPRDKE